MNREGKNELRSLLDELPSLPRAVVKVAEDLIDPDAEVILVGELSEGEKVKRVLLLVPDGASGCENCVGGMG